MHFWTKGKSLIKYFTKLAVSRDVKSCVSTRTMIKTNYKMLKISICIFVNL